VSDWLEESLNFVFVLARIMLAYQYLARINRTNGIFFFFECSVRFSCNEFARNMKALVVNICPSTMERQLDAAHL